MSDRKIALLAILAAAIIGGAFAGISKKGLEEIPPYSFTFIRLVISSLCILPLFLRQKTNKISTVFNLAPVALLATGNILFFIIGVNLTTANVGSVIYAGVPLLIAAILYFFFKKRLSRQKELGLLIGFLGVIFITLLPLFEKGHPFSGNLLGNIFLTLAIISWSFYNVYSQKLQKKYSPLMLVYSFIFVSTIILIPFFLWDLQNSFGWWNHVGWFGIISLLYSSVLATIVSYLLIQYAIKHGGVVLASTMFYIMPVFGFVVNFALLGEVLTPGFIFGSVIALLGTYLVVRK